MQTKVQRVMDIAANAAVILICTVVVTTFVQREVAPAARHSSVKPGLTAGSVFPQLPGISYGDHRLTLAVFLNTRCTACLESLPDYESLHQLVEGRNGVVQFVGVFQGESSQAIKAFGFRPKGIQVKDFGMYRRRVHLRVDRGPRGWMIAYRESAELAKRLIDTLAASNSSRPAS